MGEDSGTGVCFTRDPNTGEDVFYGDLLMNAQGEDVVAGIRTPTHLSELGSILPGAYDQLCEVRKTLETHYKDMQDIEFTIEEGKLYILQTRGGKRSPRAAFQIVVDLEKEGLITKEEALMRITDKDIEGLFYPVIDQDIDPEILKKNYYAAGIAAVPGAASGHVVFTAHDAERWAAGGKSVILVRRETSPEDVGGMHAASGILTATGGKTSHAAVVARGWGKCCIVGCGDLSIDESKKTMTMADTVIQEGDEITLNGSSGEVYKTALNLIKPVLPKEYATLMKWADQHRTLKVRTNADTPYDSKNAVKLGAEGIGLLQDRAYVLRYPGEKARDSEDDPGRRLRGKARGAQRDTPASEKRLRRNIQGHERQTGHHKAARPAAPRVRPAYREGPETTGQ